MKKVLLISPYFPPHRAIGTKRAINFVQGVHGKEDWEVIVLASKPFNNNNDPKLNTHIPANVHVDYGFIGIFRPIIKLLTGGYKTKPKTKPIESQKLKATNQERSIKQKGSLTPFDQYLWDVGSAIRKGRKLVRRFKPDVIWVNADPWSGFLVADKLSRKFKIPWVADLRDPWTIFEKKMQLRPEWTARKIKKYEYKFFSSASKVVLNSETACKAYINTYPPAFSEKFTYIRNAFNSDLLPEESINSSNDVFTFGYYGGFRNFVPSNFILKGFATFVKKTKLTPLDVRLAVKGNVYSDFWYQVDEFGIGDFINVEREVKLDQTITSLRSWDVLLISAISDFRWMISAKFYDYLYARKPILAVSDNEELNQLIDDTRSGHWANTTQDQKIVELFERFYANGRTNLIENIELIKPFGFDNQILRFREVLNEVVSS